MRRIACFRRNVKVQKLWLFCNHLWVFLENFFLGGRYITRHEQNIEKIVCFRRKKISLLAIINSFFWSFCCYCTYKNMLFTNKTVRRIMFPRQKFENFGSLAPLVRNDVFFASFWFSGLYKSSWTRHYYECYKKKDMYRQTMWFTNEILRRMQKYTKFGSLTIIYSFFSSFWFSGRYEK